MELVQVATCTSCNLYKKSVQVATCTKSQLVHNRYISHWKNASTLHSMYTRIAKPTGTASTPACHPLAQETARKFKKALKESSYVCNQVAGYNRYLTKFQGYIQDKIKVLEKELSKGKCSQQTFKALENLRDMSAFKQVSFVVGKAMQHLSDTIFVQIANMTLLRRNTYLDRINPGCRGIPSRNLSVVLHQFTKAHLNPSKNLP